MSTGEPVGPKTARGCLAGLGCAILVVIVWWGAVGLAALRILGVI